MIILFLIIFGAPKHKYIRKLCSTFCTTFWVTANLQRFEYLWNFRDATMAPLCSRTGLVGSVPKGRWRLSWTNRSYERNLGSLIQIRLETPVKWMETSLFSSSKGSTSYILCEDDVHCGVWLWWGNTAHAVHQRQTLNAAYYKSVTLQPRRPKTNWSGWCHMAVQGTLWLAKCLFLNLNFSFINWISLLLVQVATQLSTQGWVDPVPDPILAEKILGYSRESNPGPLGWQMC